MSCRAIARPAPIKRPHSPQALTALVTHSDFDFFFSAHSRPPPVFSCVCQLVTSACSLPSRSHDSVHMRASRWPASSVPSGRNVSSAFWSHMGRTCRWAPSSSWAKRSSTTRPTWRFARFCNQLLPFAFEPPTIVVPTLNKSLRFVCSSRGQKLWSWWALRRCRIRSKQISTSIGVASLWPTSTTRVQTTSPRATGSSCSPHNSRRCWRPRRPLRPSCRRRSVTFKTG